MVGSLRSRALPLLAFIVAILLCVAPGVARADDTYTYIPETGVTLTYTVADDDTASITDCALTDDFDGTLDVPTEIDGHAVVSVGDGAFSGCTSLVSALIPDSVTYIGYSAFKNCTSLSSFSFPVEGCIMGTGVFSGCTSLTYLYLPKGIYMDSQGGIGAPALTSVEFAPGCTEIPSDLFMECAALQSVDIPDTVTSIGDCAFYGCTALESIDMPDSVTRIGFWAFFGCTALESIDMPDSVTSIGGWAFYGCAALQSVDIPDTVTSIGNDAFSGCAALESIDIPDSVTEIDGSAFYGCTSLTDVRIPGSVTSIRDDAFYGCTSLTDVRIPASVRSIGSCAFYGCTSLISVLVPNSVTSIGGNAFVGCEALTLTVFEGSKAETYAKDNSIAYKYVENPIAIAVPKAASGLVYDGTEQTGVAEGEGYALSGETKATGSDSDTKLYSATAYLEVGYVWDDGTTDPKEIIWKIANGDTIALTARPSFGSEKIRYTGEALSPEFTVEQDGVALVRGTDYTWDGKYYSDVACTQETEVVDAGLYYVKIEGADAYYGTKKASVRIYGANLFRAGKVSVGDASGWPRYTSLACEAGITVTAYGKTLTEGVDYTWDHKYYADLNCTQETDASERVNSAGAKGYYYVKVEGIGNYNGPRKASFKVRYGSLFQGSIEKIASHTYDGKAYKPVPVVRNSAGVLLTQGVDYTYAYYSDLKCTEQVKSPKKAGTYYVKATAVDGSDYLSFKKKMFTITA